MTTIAPASAPWTPPFSPGEYRYILQNDLMSFTQRVFHELNPQTRFIAGAHLEVMTTKLEACRRGEIRRLIINLPPRNLKSNCVSIAFVAWLLAHDPALRIICASYGQELAEKLARDTRTVMTSRWYQSMCGTRLSDRQAVHDFETTEMGCRMATSVGGVVTGRGAEFIILDDPIKPEDALSESQRNGANDWYDHTLLSRLNDKATGCIIIVMQRLHQEDLVGHVLEQEDWDVLSFPAICETETSYAIEGPLGTRTFQRLPGEALHPERESLETLSRIRRQTGEYNFASQYQQNPMPPEGAMVKTSWLKYYEPGSEPARFGFVAQSWDTANKSGELNDFSVCTTWGVQGTNIYLLDVFRRRLNFPDLKRAVVQLYNQYRPNVVIVEDKASGTQLIHELQRVSSRIKPYQPPPGNDKMMRLHRQTVCFENGRVFLRAGAHWLQDYVAELTGFPGTKFDDQVDSTTQFLDYWGNRKPPMIITDEMLRRAAMPGPGTYRNFPSRYPFANRGYY